MCVCTPVAARQKVGQWSGGKWIIPALYVLCISPSRCGQFDAQLVSEAAMSEKIYIISPATCLASRRILVYHTLYEEHAMISSHARIVYSRMPL